MGQILLEDNEIVQVAVDLCGIDPVHTIVDVDINHDKALAKTQLKKVKSKIAVVEIPEGKSAGYNVDGKPYIALAMLREDWEALVKEVEE